jgi:hypothetical protein
MDDHDANVINLFFNHYDPPIRFIDILWGNTLIRPQPKPRPKLRLIQGGKA